MLVKLLPKVVFDVQFLLTEAFVLCIGYNLSLTHVVLNAHTFIRVISFGYLGTLPLITKLRVAKVLMQGGTRLDKSVVVLDRAPLLLETAFLAGETHSFVHEKGGCFFC